VSVVEWLGSLAAALLLFALLYDPDWTPPDIGDPND